MAAPTGSSRRIASELRAFGALVRARRQSRSWTLEQAAERMRLDLKHLQRIEAGASNVMLATLLRIAHAYGEPFVLPRTGSSSRPVALPEPTPSSKGIQSSTTPNSGGDALVRDVGHRLAEVRSARGLTQQQLATAARVSLGYVQRVEEGRHKSVALRALARLGEALGVGVRDLLEPPQGPRPRRGRPPRPLRTED